MKTTISSLGAALVALALTSAASVSPAKASGEIHMTVYGSHGAPPAFSQFCRRNPSECTARRAARHIATQNGAVILTPERRAELEHINRSVNHSIRERSDYDVFGREEVWSLPVDGVGDCEDFALLKRRELVALGWPTSALLMTVVRTSWGEGHAVLTVRTSEGDLVLDNRTSSIRRWDRTGHTFYLRQASNSPRTWQLVTHGMPMATASGSR